MIPTSFVETVRRILEEQESRSRARKHLKMYFKNVDKPKDGYSGRFFESMIKLSEPYSFTGYDVAALATLSVPLSGDAVGPSLASEPKRSTRDFAIRPFPGLTSNSGMLLGRASSPARSSISTTRSIHFQMSAACARQSSASSRGDGCS